MPESQELKFGVLVYPDAGLIENPRVFRWLEDLGFDQVFVLDHSVLISGSAPASSIGITTRSARNRGRRGVATSPGSIQRPRPTIITGGQSPTVLRVSTERADVWNTHGPIVDDPVEILETTAREGKPRRWRASCRTGISMSFA